MELIKDTVKNVIESLATKKGIPGEWPQERIKKILTQKELRHIKVNYFSKGILGVNVDSSTWLYHLSLRKEDLLENLRKDFGQLKDIRFRIGETK